MKKLSLLLFTFLITQNLYSFQIKDSLVSASWLSENLNNVKILDVRKQMHTFNSIGHIKGAILVKDKDVRVNRTINNKALTRLIPTQNEFDKFIRKHSINKSDAIVITHQGLSAGNVVSASRLYWHFKVYAYDNIALLDGGNKSWHDDALEELVKSDVKSSMRNFKCLLCYA